MKLDLQVRVRVSESEWEKQRVRVSEIFFLTLTQWENFWKYSVFT